MPHESEAEFADWVAEWFRQQYGADAVEKQVWLPDERWYADLVVDCGWCRLFVEIENDADSVRPGFGQAAGYAGTDHVEGRHLVVTPPDHLDADRAEALRNRGAHIREFDGEAGEWR